MIGCTNRRADLGIPRTQAGRSGSGLGARRHSSRGSPASHLGDADPTPPPYATTTATAPDRFVGSGAGPGGPRPAPARAGASPRRRSRLLMQSGPAPPARARGSGWDGLNLHDGHQHGSEGQYRPARALGATRASRWFSAGSGVGSMLPSRGSRSGGRPSDQGCRVWIAGSFATVGTAGSIRSSRNLGIFTYNFIIFSNI
jgi:hypothetical protein